MIEETPLECLSRLGTSGVLWAKEFNKTAVKLGYSEMDEEWLAGWFANAIENCDVIRCNPLRTENEKLRELVKAAYYEAYRDRDSLGDAGTDDPEDRCAWRLSAAAAAIRESGDE